MYNRGSIHAVHVRLPAVLGSSDDSGRYAYRHTKKNALPLHGEDNGGASMK